MILIEKISEILMATCPQSSLVKRQLSETYIEIPYYPRSVTCVPGTTQQLLETLNLSEHCSRIRAGEETALV